MDDVTPSLEEKVIVVPAIALEPQFRRQLQAPKQALDCATTIFHPGPNSRLSSDCLGRSEESLIVGQTTIPDKRCGDMWAIPLLCAAHNPILN